MSNKTPKPSAFEENTVIYEDQHFAVAYGRDSDGNKRVAMRWKGDGVNDMGFPKVFGNPQWFLLTEYGNWTPEILRAVDKIKEYGDRLKMYESEC